MKAIFIARMLDGTPDINFDGLDVSWVLGANLPGHGIYVIAGSTADLQAIDAQPGVVGIGFFASEQLGDTARWVGLDTPLPDGVRTKLQNYIDNNHPAWGQIPQGVTKKDVLKFVGRKMNPDFDWTSFEIQDHTATPQPFQVRGLPDVFENLVKMAQKEEKFYKEPEFIMAVAGQVIGAAQAVMLAVGVDTGADWIAPVVAGISIIPTVTYLVGRIKSRKRDESKNSL